MQHVAAGRFLVLVRSEAVAQMTAILAASRPGNSLALLSPPEARAAEEGVTLAGEATLWHRAVLSRRRDPRANSFLGELRHRLKAARNALRLVGQAELADKLAEHRADGPLPARAPPASIPVVVEPRGPISADGLRPTSAGMGLTPVLKSRKRGRSPAYRQPEPQAPACLPREAAAQLTGTPRNPPHMTVGTPLVGPAHSQAEAAQPDLMEEEGAATSEVDPPDGPPRL